MAPDTAGPALFFIDNDVQQRVLTVGAAMDAIEDAYREWDAGQATIGPKTNLYVYNDNDWSDILKTVDATSPYALTGAVFANDRRALIEHAIAIGVAQPIHPRRHPDDDVLALRQDAAEDVEGRILVEALVDDA